MKRLKQRRGTFSLEYAVLIVCVVAGLIAMQIYIKRSIQGKLRQTSDSIGEQYAPGNTTSDITQTFNYNSNTAFNPTDDAGLTTTTTQTNFVQNDTRIGTERLGPLQ